MKTKITTIISVLALSLGLWSCSDSWEPVTDKSGSVALACMEVEVDNAEKVVSRAGVDKNDFLVKIYDDKDVLVGNWVYGTMPEIVTLNVGDYRVDVMSHEIKKSEWDAPYFFGSKTFSVVDSKITEVGTVVCSFSSLKVSVIFDEQLRKVLGDDVTVTVRANDSGALVFTPDETRSGYFEVVKGSTTLTLVFAGTVKGNYEEIIKAYTDVEPGQHRIVTYSLKSPGGDIPDESGNVDPTDGIDIDVSYTDENLNGNVDDTEETLDPSDRPGHEGDTEDPDEPTPPTPTDGKIEITSDALSFDEPNGLDKGDQAIVNISAEKGISHVVVEITTDNDEFRAAVSDLLPLSFDLAEPGDQKEAFESLGFPTGADVIGKPSIVFDIRQFVPLLQSFPGTHNFKLTVTDSENNTLSKTLTFNS